MAGRPKPTKLKLIEGNRGKRPLPKGEPKPRPVSPGSPPPDLNTRAKKIWKEYAPKLERLGLLTEVDGGAFAALCQTMARLDEVRRELKRKDVTLVVEKYSVDKDGVAHLVGTSQNPLAVMERQLAEQVRKWAAEFGLTPRGRSGLAVAGGGADEDDEFKGLLT